MQTGRLEAFSDGVFAIVITIMVLELEVPVDGDSFADLSPIIPVFASYVLSFIYIGIYWNNHHHLLQATKRIDSATLWANLHLLFWLSLIPFAAGWSGRNFLEPSPTLLYGLALTMSGLAYWILESRILASNHCDSLLKTAIGQRNKGRVSIALYGISLPLALRWPMLSFAIYAGVALLWVVPNRLIEEALDASAPSDKTDTAPKS